MPTASPLGAGDHRGDRVKDGDDLLHASIFGTYPNYFAEVGCFIEA